MGTYAFVRFSLPMFPQAVLTPWVTGVMVTLAMIGIVYGAMVTLVQKDMKKLIAYSSVSHLGFVMLGIFALNMAGIQGAILQMVNHGISTGALFLLVGILYERRHTRMIADFGGLARPMPLYATSFLIIALSSMGLPLLNGFIGGIAILPGPLARALGGGPLRVEPPDWLLLAPELALTASGLLLLALATLFPKAKEEFLGFLSFLSVVVTAIVLTLVAAAAPRGKGPIFGGMFVLDNFALFFKYLILLSVGLTILASIQYVGAAAYPGGEYYALLLFTGVGMLFMVSGSNLISIYVSLELMALASYVLAGYFKEEPRSMEAALKYFVLGAFSSGVLLYGLSLVYGISGRMGLTDLAQMTTTADDRQLAGLGILLVLAGLLFKIAAAPFHVWTPDVYEGSPTPIAAFFSVGPKVAAYAILARIFYVAFPKFQADS